MEARKRQQDISCITAQRSASCLRCLSHGSLPYQPAEARLSAGLYLYVDIARARAQPADGLDEGDTRRDQGETSVLLVPLHRVLCAFDGQHPMLSGEITLSQSRRAWTGGMG